MSKTASAEEFDRRFDDEDVMEFIDTASAVRVNESTRKKKPQEES